MKKYQSYIPEFENPYPSKPVKITYFRYDNALILLRLVDKQKVKFSSKKDSKYIVAANYTVTWFKSCEDTGTQITVPRGMISDLTSVPKIFRPIIGRVGPWLEAVIVHDFLTIAWRTYDGKNSAMRRRFSDHIMWVAMNEANVGWKKYLIYFAIRVWAFWEKNFLGYINIDPKKQNDLYVDLDDPEVQEQLPTNLKI